MLCAAVLPGSSVPAGLDYFLDGLRVIAFMKDSGISLEMQVSKELAAANANQSIAFSSSQKSQADSVSFISKKAVSSPAREPTIYGSSI